LSPAAMAQPVARPSIRIMAPLVQITPWLERSGRRAIIAVLIGKCAVISTEIGEMASRAVREGH